MTVVDHRSCRCNSTAEILILFVTIILLTNDINLNVAAFQLSPVPPVGVTKTRKDDKDHSTMCLCQQNQKKDTQSTRLLLENQEQSNNIQTRRGLLQNSITYSTATIMLSSPFLINKHTFAASLSTTTTTALSIDYATNLNRKIDLYCLQDLPPISTGCIRIYFCRHGQTENNRLRKVQGARIDPPINDNGIQQSENLGKALANRFKSNEKTKKSTILICTSPLLRATMTAEIASKVTNNNSNSAKIKQVDSLTEVDFGPFAENRPIRLVQEKMTQSYAAWSIGNIDYRPQGGGDSGREVLLRACKALEELVQEANKANASCVAAVSHSAFLRVLLALILDEPLLLSVSRKIYNGSITVVDVSKSFTNNSHILESKPNLLGGPISQKPNDFSLNIPNCRIIRINEFRHLPPSTL